MQKNGIAQAAKRDSVQVSRMVEDVIGCKWSMAVLGLVRNGIYRPGAMERELPGLTTKVLNERLRNSCVSAYWSVAYFQKHRLVSNIS